MSPYDTDRKAREMTELDDWARHVSSELGVEAVVDVDAILDLAASAAHAVVRPAAPLTTFLAGLAAGRAGGTADDIRAAIAQAAALCEERG